MNSTLQVLRAIGSPSAGVGEPASESTVSQLVDCAMVNKIGLLFLETIKKHQKLDHLEPIYQKEWNRYQQTLVTAQRVADLFEQSSVKYALYKTLKPFPITPNDVDVLLLGDEREQEKAIATLRNAGFSTVGVAPLQTCMYDTRDGGHGDHDKQGGTYYVDLYREASASYVIYLNKESLKATTQLVETPACCQQVQTLCPQAELLAALVHSVFPEQLYTLNDYYTTLYYLAQMNDDEKDDFVRMAKRNSVSYTVRSSLGITSALHQAAHGIVPSALEKMLTALGGITRETSNFTSRSLDTPYRYGILTLITFILERAGEATGRKSIIKQLSNMWRPRFASYILRVAIERRARETY